ncbi:hypothetical protein Bbelb_180690 [Branchiostoma belcheri]|nr:hypothetical protein Bbelb_180690 [Branchiostoma belcheri]
MRTLSEGVPVESGYQCYQDPAMLFYISPNVKDCRQEKPCNSRRGYSGTCLDMRQDVVLLGKAFYTNFLTPPRCEWTMLTREEALNFLAGDLRITGAERRLLDDKLGLLNEAIRSYHNSVPFQNLTLFSMETRDRAAPTPDQIKQDVLSGKGGLCLTQNVFFFYLLQALGYDVFLISCASHRIKHVTVVARNVAEKGDVYLVEVGCGFPTFQAIPLDFQELSPVYQHSFLEYRFVKKGELIERQHRRGDTRPLGPGQQAGTWREFYAFTLEPRDLDFFREPMNTVYTVPGRFLQSLRVITFQKDRLRAIKDWSLLEEQDDHTLRETQIHSMHEMMAIIKELAPKVDQATVTKALSHWQEASK